MEVGDREKEWGGEKESEREMEVRERGGEKESERD